MTDCVRPKLRQRGARLLSIVTPAYREAENLNALYERLRSVLDAIDVDWEWIVIDDHSPDETFAVLKRICEFDNRVRAIRFSRNFGSHAAISCGIGFSRGDCAVVIAGDLQDPPEVIPKMLERCNRGAHVVWAVRGDMTGAALPGRGFARAYYWLMRNFVGLGNMPASGADFLLMDRRVLDAVKNSYESNVSLFSLICWMGFRQESILCDKQERHGGESGWTLSKKLKLVVDSVAGFSYAPIRLMSWLGVLTGLGGFAYASFVTLNALIGNPQEGWSSLMVIVLLLGGMQMLMMGVLGEYIWRALDESRRRPRFLVEDSFNLTPQTDHGRSFSQEMNHVG